MVHSISSDESKGAASGRLGCADELDLCDVDRPVQCRDRQAAHAVDRFRGAVADQPVWCCRSYRQQRLDQIHFRVVGGRNPIANDNPLPSARTMIFPCHDATVSDPTVLLLTLGQDSGALTSADPMSCEQVVSC